MRRETLMHPVDGYSVYFWLMHANVFSVRCPLIIHHPELREIAFLRVRLLDECRWRGEGFFRIKPGFPARFSTLFRFYARARYSQQGNPQVLSGAAITLEMVNFAWWRYYGNFAVPPGALYRRGSMQDDIRSRRTRAAPMYLHQLSRSSEWGYRLAGVAGYLSERSRRLGPLASGFKRKRVCGTPYPSGLDAFEIMKAEGTFISSSDDRSAGVAGIKCKTGFRNSRYRVPFGSVF